LHQVEMNKYDIIYLVIWISNTWIKCKDWSCCQKFKYLMKHVKIMCNH